MKFLFKPQDVNSFLVSPSALPIFSNSNFPNSCVNKILHPFRASIPSMSVRQIEETQETDEINAEKKSSTS